MATAVMDGATATATVMDGAMATHRQRKAQRQRKGNDGDGRHDGNGDGWRSGNAMAMTAMDGPTAMAMDGATEMQCRWKAWRQRNSDDGDSNGRHDGGLAMTTADVRILPTPNLRDG